MTSENSLVDSFKIDHLAIVLQLLLKFVLSFVLFFYGLKVQNFVRFRLSENGPKDDLPFFLKCWAILT
jgi:hypothetical protein